MIANVSKPYNNEFIKALRKGAMLIACRVCGQCHPKESTHLYDYQGYLKLSFSNKLTNKKR